MLRFLKNALNNPNKPPERDVIELVKSKSKLFLKARSTKMESVLKNSFGTWSDSINDIVQYDQYSFEDERFEKLIARKRKAFENQTTQFDEVTPSADITAFLKDFTIYLYELWDIREKKIKADGKFEDRVTLMLKRAMDNIGEEFF